MWAPKFLEPYSRACPGFFLLGVKTEGPKAESGGEVLGEGQQPPPAGGSGERCDLPQRFGDRNSDCQKVFHLFSALRMASSDTITLLMLDYHAAIGGRTVRPRAASPPCVCPWPCWADQCEHRLISAAAAAAKCTVASAYLMR